MNRALTFREDQIARLVCQAMLNKEIAFELHLTEGTIKEYLNRIFRKLQVKNRTELAIWAMCNLKPVSVAPPAELRPASGLQSGPQICPTRSPGEKRPLLFG
jgi:DNA-binding CsgD family transcriptional regulator